MMRRSDCPIIDVKCSSESSNAGGDVELICKRYHGHSAPDLVTYSIVTKEK